MSVFILCFVAGVCFLQQRSALPDPDEQALLVVIAVTGILFIVLAERLTKSVAGGRRILPALANLGFAALGISVGILWAGASAQWRMHDTLAHALEGKDVTVTGVVATMPEIVEHGVRFEFDVEQASDPVPRHLRLGWYYPRQPAEGDGIEAINESGGPSAIHAGARWQLTVRLKRPHGTYNPNGFDAEGWLLERGIRATGYVRDSALSEPRLVTPLADGMAYAVESLRDNIRARFYRVLESDLASQRGIMEASPGGRYAGLLVALAIGDQSSIPAPQWQIFARTGITHLMSISGMHITMLAALSYAFAAMIWRLFARSGGVVAARLQNWPMQTVATLAGLCAATGYCLLAGFAVPAQRTLYMLVVAAVARWLRRDLAVSHVLLLALLVVVLVDPWSVLSAGFWLSFIAVAVLLLTALDQSPVTNGSIPSRGLQWLRMGLANWFASQWAVTVGLLPIVLALFGQFSLISPIANAIAIPLISFVVTPMVLLAVAGMDFLLPFAHEVATWTMVLIEALSSLPSSVWHQAAPPWWAVGLALLGAGWMLAPRGFPLRWLGVMYFLPVLTWQAPRPEHGEVWVRVLDVGQGLSVHVQTAQHDLLFDAGPTYSSDTDAGNRIIVPYLQAAGIGELSVLAISHGDSDHIGGAASILGGVTVQHLVHSLPPTTPLLQQFGTGVRTSPCRAGESDEWDGVRLHWLHPAGGEEHGAATRVRRNSVACVLRVEAGGHAILLPSDIEAAQESVLVARRDTENHSLAADVLVAPHHGSRTSSTDTFLDAVGARTVIFPVGYRNRFGHPKEDIVDRYRQRQYEIARTDSDGAVSVAISAKGVVLERERRAHPRYWHEG